MLLSHVWFAFGLLLSLGCPGAQTGPAPTKEIDAAIRHATQLPLQDRIPALLAVIQRAHELKDVDGEAVADLSLGQAYNATREFDKAFKASLDSLPLFRQCGDRSLEAAADAQLGFIDRAEAKPDEALGYFHTALAISKEIGDQVVQAMTYAGIAGIEDQLGDLVNSELDYARAVAIRTRLNDLPEEAAMLNLQGAIDVEMGNYDTALRLSHQALLIWQGLKDELGEAKAHAGLGAALFRQGFTKQAIEEFKDALVVDIRLKGAGAEASTRDYLGLAEVRTGQLDAALRDFNRAREIFRALGLGDGESEAINNTAMVYLSQGEPRKAIDPLNAALEMRRALKEPEGEATVLNNLGAVYAALSDQRKAIENYRRALAIEEHVPDPQRKLATLAGLGVASNELGYRANALEYYDQALAIATSVGDVAGAATAQLDRSSLLFDLGLTDQAVVANRDSLARYRSVGDVNGEAAALNNLAAIDFEGGDAEAALEIYQRALALRKRASNQAGVGLELSNLGAVYFRLSRFPESVAALNQALAFQRKSEDLNGQASTLTLLGMAQRGLSRSADALKSLVDALAIERKTSDRSDEAVTLSAVSGLFAADGRPALAILPGKLAINVYQSLNRDSVAIGPAATASLRKSVSPTYRAVANLLASQGRLEEAEQVLDLLKDDEYFRFLSTRAAAGSQAVDLTPLEKTWAGKYDAISKDFGALSTEFDALTAVDPAKRTPAQNARLKAIDSRFEACNKALDDYFDSARAAFAKANAAEERLTDLQAATGMTDTLKALPDHPAAVYTMVTEDGVHLLLNLPNGSVTRDPVKNVRATDLSLKVLAFRQALQDPRVDPRPLGAELYDLLVRPIEPDLERAHVGTIMWSLDSYLRYIPMWALYDSKTGKYLIEKYPSALFTPRTLDRQTRDVHPSDWTGAEFGVSRAGTVGGLAFPALPGVPNELKAVAAQIGGAPKVDAAFTEDAFKAALDLKPKVVHIATHFNFIPGDDKDSFLVLGNGEMSVDEFKSLRNGALDGVELLVLSACNTAEGGGQADGGEFESFALLAQLKGADSVMATLWPVSDASTSLLMGEFYRLRKAHPEWTKLEALRQAQLEMIHGTLTGETTPARGAALKAVKNGLPAWNGKGFSHPFYWAPFELVGNWK